MKRADLLLNFIFEGAQTEMISGKLLEYFATGVPVLYLGNPNLPLIIHCSRKLCAYILPNQQEEIVAFLSECYKQQDTPFNAFSNLQDWSREAISQQRISKVLT